MSHQRRVARQSQENTAIRRPFRAAPTPTKDGPRSNRDIRGVRDVQLIDDTGVNRGVVSFFEALKIVQDGERRAWGLDTGGDGEYTVIIERKGA